MKRMFLILSVCMICRFVTGAAEVAAVPAAAALEALEAGQIQTAKQLHLQITNPAARLYVQACIERAQGNPKRAIQTAAQVIALYSGEKEWLAESELLSAELYLELKMPEAADVTARQVQTLYAGMDVVKSADALRSEIKKLKKGAE